MNRVLARSFILAALALQATSVHAATILDNTSNLTAGFGFTRFQYQNNSSPYKEFPGITFEVQATSYDVTAVSLGLQAFFGFNPNQTFRIQFWELPGFTAQAPASNATPFYSQDYPVTLTSSAEYYTFTIAESLNLKAFTRYSLGVRTDLGDGTTYWLAPSGNASPSSSDATTISYFESVDSGASFTTTGMSNYSIQLTGDAAAPVPEPSTWALALAGVTCSAWGMARRRRQATGDACDA